MNRVSEIQAIAFYLPQFHPTRENDRIWHPGFSEWHNVAKGSPRFLGHEQPKFPGRLGFYDLRARQVLVEQVALAKAYGISAFCFYYYRFGAERLLDTPVRQFLAHPLPRMPFLYCWANENWTRAWDGRTSEVTFEQRYDAETVEGLEQDLLTAMADQRYLRVAGRPLFLVYQIEKVHEWRSFLMRLREKIFAERQEELLIGAVYSHGLLREHAAEVDLVVQFPPHRLPRQGARKLVRPEDVGTFDPQLGDHFELYEDVIESAINCVDAFENLVPAVCPDWDNSVRRAQGAHMLLGATPERFKAWTTRAATMAMDKAARRALPVPMLFVNAWNEWAEGAMLEPSLLHGERYLEAFRQGLELAQ